MSLPNITIPLELPIDIPVLLHPTVVHFVIAIPVIVLILELINLIIKRRTLSVLSLFLLVLVMVAMAGAYFSGVTDGKEALSLLSPEGQSELKEHKLIGIYLVYISASMVILKLLFMAFSKMVAKLFFILLLIGFIALIFIQGKDGGELVYKYGANSEAVANIVSSTKNELKESDESTTPKEEPKVQEETKTPEATTEPKKEEATTTEVATEPKKEEATTTEVATEPKKEETATTEVATEPKKEETATTEVATESKKEEVTTTEVTTEPKKEETTTTEATTESKVEEHAVSLEIPADTKPANAN